MRDIVQRLAHALNQGLVPVEHAVELPCQFLETALFNVPQVVVYKGHPISITIARAVVKIKFISLVNLIMDKQVVKELIQQDCTDIRIAAELQMILNDVAYRSAMLAEYDKLDERMGKPGASAKTAGLIIQYASKKNNAPR